ncbi:hypothetical protein JVX98_28330 [Ensifer sp. PDNC004]|uniref:hypothetical protein n=1 Tax=Ensifer sp. PDNC004 TaxID=2811423 RepID=UPI0019652D9A|nr:hypothetical protein [Ensifer sp. PDNC004]QRY68197.1 hypothetical protein JVX98_28330 [Ensifer sp. PDNC004]
MKLSAANERELQIQRLIVEGREIAARASRMSVDWDLMSLNERAEKLGVRFKIVKDEHASEENSWLIDWDFFEQS